MKWNETLSLMFIITKYKGYLRLRARISAIELAKSCTKSITRRGFSTVYIGDFMFEKKRNTCLLGSNYLRGERSW